MLKIINLVKKEFLQFFRLPLYLLLWCAVIASPIIFKNYFPPSQNIQSQIIVLLLMSFFIIIYVSDTTKNEITKGTCVFLFNYKCNFFQISISKVIYFSFILMPFIISTLLFGIFKFYSPSIYLLLINEVICTYLFSLVFKKYDLITFFVSIVLFIVQYYLISKLKLNIFIEVFLLSVLFVLFIFAGNCYYKSFSFRKEVR